MCDARMWQSQINAFTVPVNVPNMVGADNVKDLAASILDEAPAHFAMAGLSMGGIVAFEVWRQAPERVSHLALIDTNPFADAREKQSLRLEQIEQVLAGGLRELARDSLKPLYLAEANRADDELLNVILSMALELGAEAFEQQSLLLKNRPDSVATLQSISCPVSVICGREDTLCPVTYHEYMAARIPDASLLVIDNCGHLSSMEQPDAVTNELARLFTLDAPTGKMHAHQ